MQDSPPFLDIAPEIEAAILESGPVVALESTIICHGMPYPDNTSTALKVENAVRENGATPATIAILGGRLKIGLSDSEIDYLGSRGKKINKVSRRDLPLTIAGKEDGATTVASTMMLAAMAGVPVFATGGIGGVHRGVGDTMDISADLLELARTNVAVVCAGIKSVLDIGRTLEHLETHGVPVIGFRTASLPAFYAQDSGYCVDRELQSATEIALAMQAKWAMNINGGLVVANPIPAKHALDRSMIDAVIDAAIEEMEERGISGKNTTPFLLQKIAERTGGESLNANIELVLNNARLGAEIAVEFSRLNDETTGRNA